MAESARRQRGASEVIGFIFVFGLVLSSVTVVSVVGIDVLSEARSAEQMENAGRAFEVLAENVEKVSGGEAPRRATEMDLATAQLFTADNVTVNVTATGGTRATVERTVRPVLYRGQDEMSLFYEAGAVIRTDRNGAVVLRSPSVIVDDDRALVHVPALQSPYVVGVGSSTVRVVATERNRTVDVHDRGGTYDRLLVNVTSPRRAAWESILAEEGFGSCATGTDGDGQRFVTCERAPPSGFDRLYVSSVRMDVGLDR